MTQWIAGLIGVVLGFGLNQVTEFFKYKHFSTKMKEALEDELDTNLHQIDQKIDIANQMKKALNYGNFLPGRSVPFASSVYDHHFAFILKHLSSIQRDNIRHIFSNLKVLDDILSSMEKSYKDDIQQGVLSDANSAYLGKIDDILSNYNILKELISSYLNGNPKDIYYRDKHIT